MYRKCYKYLIQFQVLIVLNYKIFYQKNEWVLHKFVYLNKKCTGECGGV